MLDLKTTIDREWLQGRYLVLELAALLDRVEAAGRREAPREDEDPRLALLREAIEELPIEGVSQSRTERILRLYSQLAHTA